MKNGWIQAKELEKDEREKVKQNRINKREQKRNEAVSKKRKSVDNNQPSASYEHYPVSENVETIAKRCSSKQTVQKRKYSDWKLSSSESESELSDFSASDLYQICKRS